MYIYIYAFISKQETEELRVSRAGNSLAVKWLGFHWTLAFTAEGAGSIPSRGAKIPQATWSSQKNKKRVEGNGNGTGKEGRGNRPSTEYLQSMMTGGPGRGGAAGWESNDINERRIRVISETLS